MYRAYFSNDCDAKELIYPHDTGTEAIWILELGKSNPPPNYSIPPLKRKIFVLHYIKSGKGRFHGQPFEGPCAFIMTPDQPHQYTIDSDSPFCDQYWIKVSGPSARGFLKEAGFPETDAVFPCNYLNDAYQIFDELFDTDRYEKQTDRYYMLQGFFRLCSLQAKSNSALKISQKKFSPYTQKLLKHIHENYFSPIKEIDLAREVHLSVRYMHRIFKAEIGVPPIRYLNTYRLKCAKMMLMESTFPIFKIAETCGFPDPTYFSYVFEQNYHISPSKFRKQYQKRD